MQSCSSPLILMLPTISPDAVTTESCLCLPCHSREPTTYLPSPATPLPVARDSPPETTDTASFLIWSPTYNKPSFGSSHSPAQTFNASPLLLALTYSAKHNLWEPLIRLSASSLLTPGLGTGRFSNILSLHPQLSGHLPMPAVTVTDANVHQHCQTSSKGQN